MDVTVHGNRHRSIPRGTLAWLVSLIAVLVVGCAGTRYRGVTEVLVPFSEEDQILREQARSAQYRLRVGDVLNLDFKYNDDLDQRGVRILPDGTISVAGLGVIRAAGYTLTGLDSMLTARFSADLRDPELSIAVVELADYEVYVLGEVRRPGLYKLPTGGANALQAVALAGGFRDAAAKSETVVMRVTDEGLKYIHVDLSHLEKDRGLGGGEVMLRPYDVVYVPKTAIGDFAYFTKNILKPVLDFSELYWDIYAVANIDKVDRIVR